MHWTGVCEGKERGAEAVGRWGGGGKEVAPQH